MYSIYDEIQGCWGWAALGGTAAALVTMFATPAVEGLWTHESTAQEKSIEQGISKALHGDDVKVNCVSAEWLAILRLKPLERLYGVGFARTNTVWLRKDICKDLGDFQQQPLQGKDLAYRDFEQASPDAKRKVASLAIAAHEAGHSNLDTLNESSAECYANQLAGKLAVAYGMDPANEASLLRSVTDWQYILHAGKGMEEYRFNLSQCRDGGPGDLNPGHPGIFPDKP